MVVSSGTASVHLTKMGTRWFAHDLESGGNPADLISLLRKIQQMASIEAVFVTVDEDNPDKDRLLRLYRRMGAKPVLTWLKVGN